MSSLRLRTKFLLSFLLVSTGLTGASLLIVRHTVQKQVRLAILGELHNSILTFQQVQLQRQTTFSRSAELLANIPILKALMTTQHAATIQDASRGLWRLGGSDVFLLADRRGKIVALHASTPGLTHSRARELLEHSLREEEPRRWWFGGGHLYEMFLEPIYFGSAADNRLLGFVALGYEIDARVAEDVSRVAASQVAFRYGNAVVASTLSPDRLAELVHQTEKLDGSSAVSDEIRLGQELFLATSVDLAPGTTPALRLIVLKSYDQATAFLENLNHLLLALGLAALFGGSALVFLISGTFTRPLENLVAGVRALEKGDFAYPIEPRGDDEVAEVSGAFHRMRSSLHKTQQQLLEAERLAIIGRMAGSISHDLRHPLAAVVANAEFLTEGRLDGRQREELYQEIRVAVNQMTDLVDWLLEFSRTRESLRPTLGSLLEPIDHAIRAVRALPEFHHVSITVSADGRAECWFDPKKMERVFYNLLLNACEAVSAGSGKIELHLSTTKQGVEIRVADDGPGLPPAIRENVFQPFVSFGKEKGTGLGLTIVQKILQDHGGDVCLESSRPGRTVFRIILPLTVLREAAPPPATGEVLNPPLVPIKPAE